MATYFLSGAGLDTNNGLSWAAPKQTMAGIIALSLVAGDVIVCDKANQFAYAAAQSWSFTTSLLFVSSTNPGSGTTITPTPMDIGVSLGPRTGNFSLTVGGTFAGYLHFWGVAFSPGAGNTTGASFNGDNINWTFDNCRFDCTGSSQSIILGPSTSSGATVRMHIKDCSWRPATANNRLSFRACPALVERLTIDTTLVTPTGLTAASDGHNLVTFTGCDLSPITGSLLSSNNTSIAGTFIFHGCKLGAGVVPLAAQSQPVGHDVYLLDCSSGDNHGIFGYYNAKGSALTDTGTRLTAGAAGQSWKIVTNAYATVLDPFRTPPIPLYHTGTSAITPYIECLRNDGTASVLNDNQVWAEVMCKTIGGSPLLSDFTDRISILDIATGGAGTAQDAGAGTGAWTIASPNNPASFKINSGAAITPAEVGDISFRVCVAGARTVFIDPQPRT